MTVLFTFLRYLVEYEDKADSVEDALLFLAKGEARSELSSYGSVIKTEAGEVLLQGDELATRVDETWAALA